MKANLLNKPQNRWLVALVVFAGVISGSIALYTISEYSMSSEKSTSKPVDTALRITQVTALGHLQPEAEVIRLSTPLSLNDDHVGKLLVKEGDYVKAGQVIAILDSRASLQDALQQAHKQVGVAQAKLKQVKAGAKNGEILAQQATVELLQVQLQTDRTAQQETIARLQAQWEGDRMAQEATIKRIEVQLNNAQVEYERYQKLYQDGAISNSQFDTKRLNLETLKHQISEAQAVIHRINQTASRQIREAQIALNRINITGSKQISEAKATLNKIAEVRPVDIEAAQTEIENATAGFQRAQTDLKQAEIKAPISGSIIKIHARSGEKIGDNGILEIAPIEQMVAVAEVYQSDISKIKLQQQATVTGTAFKGNLRGVVSYIGMHVDRQNVFSNVAGENLGRRVVKVKIRLNPEDSRKVTSLTNLQVQTAIQL